jgi:hypothetical protein
MHWFGPIDIPNPVVQIGGVATTLSTIYIILFALAGLIVGVVVASMGYNTIGRKHGTTELGSGARHRRSAEPSG